AYRQLKKELGRSPTELELASALEVPKDQLRMLQQVRQGSLSLNHRIGKEEDTELIDLLEDEITQSPEQQMTDRMLRQEIFQVLATVLTPREQDVVALRYGLKSGEPRTLEEVSHFFHLSRERVRQIQSKALRKLRRSQLAERLKGWLF
ncbi:MAG TPA: sigma-70 family RNA polymerase sigma factor, partial [Candidatus Caenarcaniphilales bacterium]